MQLSTSNFGRPRSDFSGKSEKGKRVEVPTLVSGCSTVKLAFAAGVSLYKSSKREGSPTSATKIIKIGNAQPKEPVSVVYGDEEALQRVYT